MKRTLLSICILVLLLPVCRGQNTDGQSDQMTQKAWEEAFREKCRITNSPIERFMAYEEYPWWGKDGLIPVQVEDKWGFADTNANIVIKPQFKYVSYFYEERAGVCAHRKKWGYIDTSGSIVIPLKYDLVGRFKFGTVFVMKGRGHWFELDKEGNVLDSW